LEFKNFTNLCEVKAIANGPENRAIEKIMTTR